MVLFHCLKVTVLLAPMGLQKLGLMNWEVLSFPVLPVCHVWTVVKE